MRKKWIAAVLSGALLLGLAGCSSEPDTVVYVQNVSEIAGAGSIAMDNLFAGLVVSENVTEVQRDQSKTVEQLFVTQGQEVNQGDILFQYDSEAMSIQLDKEKLTLERLKNTSSTLNSQITQLKNEQKKASKDDQLSYTIEIQDREAQLKENEYNIKVKNKEISQLQDALANVKVISPVTGRVVSINENGYDQNGNPSAYITIQQSGSYRIKGTVNELNMGSINVGDTMRIVSRADESQTWTGTVTVIDQESATQGSSNDYMFGMGTTDTMTSSSKYTFYVEPTSVEGMMLGQHVYMEVDRGDTEDQSGLWLPEYYICYTEDGEPYVWAANSKDRLEQRSLELGDYNDMALSYEILDGLTLDDRIAFPEPACKEGAGVTQDLSQVTVPESGADGTEPIMDDNFYGDGIVDDGFVDGGFVDGDFENPDIDYGSDDGGMSDSFGSGSVDFGSATDGDLDPDEDSGIASGADLEG